MGYYRQYVPDFATIAKPLSQLTGKGITWNWDEGAQNAFDQLRQKMMVAPILGYPNPREQYILDTDASGVGWELHCHNSNLDRKRSSLTSARL